MSFQNFPHIKFQEIKKNRNRATSLCDSEIITLLISFHNGQFRNFKHFYINYVCVHLKNDFPHLVSYNRFIELSLRHALVFMLFIQYARKGSCTGISFIDSTVLRVCHNKRIRRNKVFKGIAEVGKSTMGWFFGKKALSNEEKILLQKRSVIETVNDELKNICQVEHTRHRSISGFLLNIMGAIAAYSFFPKKPSIKNDVTENNPKLLNHFFSQLSFAA